MLSICPFICIKKANAFQGNLITDVEMSLVLNVHMATASCKPGCGRLFAFISLKVVMRLENQCEVSQTAESSTGRNRYEKVWGFTPHYNLNAPFLQEMGVIKVDCTASLSFDNVPSCYRVTTC